MRFASIGSGSEGNGLVVESGSTRVMIDCGFGVRDAATRLQRIGVAQNETEGARFGTGKRKDLLDVSEREHAVGLRMPDLEDARHPELTQSRHGCPAGIHPWHQQGDRIAHPDA